MLNRTYEDFAKFRKRIENMPEETEQQKAKKTKALALWYVLKGLCFDTNP